MSKSHVLFVNVALLLLGMWAGLSIFLPWHWSILMDEVGYIYTMRNYPDLFTGIVSQFTAYWGSGRFYPVKFVMNLLEWRYLPLSAKFFHQFHFAIALLALSFSWLAMSARTRIGSFQMGAGSYLFLLGSAVLAKPILDMVQFLSVGESWVTFYFACGLFFLAKEKPILTRIFFILAAGCKEPAAGVFLCLASYHLLAWPGLIGSRLKKSGWVILDILLFMAFTTAALLAMRAGTYLANYSAFSLAGLQYWLYSLARMAFFLSPLLILAAFCFRSSPGLLQEILKNSKERAWHAFLLAFILGYLFLVTPMGASGYLQIPAALAALVFIFPFAWKGIVILEQKRFIWSVALAAYFLIIGGYSVQRWSAYAHGINEVSLVFQELVRSSNPRLILVYGEEAAAHLETQVKKEGWKNVRIAEAKSFQEDLFRDFRGEVLLLEPTRYFLPLPNDLINGIGSWAGGWKLISQPSSSYRAYFGEKSQENP